MFKITPIQNETERKKLFSKYGIIPREGFLSYLMYNMENGEPMGISQFDITGESGYISDLRSVGENEDFEAMFILGRQTMNFINSCGLDICRASLDAGNTELMKAIGFKAYESFYECNTAGMFDGSHCSGHNKNKP